jgi:hypothetical protein
MELVQAALIPNNGTLAPSGAGLGLSGPAQPANKNAKAPMKNPEAIHRETPEKRYVT